jgi:uncharacterized membrane-anchored protein
MVAGDRRRVTPIPPARRVLSKVPEVTVYFWIIKVLTTGTGEAMSDYLVHTIDPYIAVVFGLLALVAALALQAAARQYVTWIYWLAVLMVAVFGTMVADALHIGLHIPYLVSTVAFSIVLAAVFVTWYATEKTLSIHSIYTRRRECFYWATVIATFALGTAAGDMTASTLHLGFLASGIMFAVAIMVPAAAYRWLRVNAILCFWTAYVLTRPLGASFADWLGVPHSLSGLDLGRGRVALAGLFLIVCFVGFLMVTHRDAPSEPDLGPAPRTGLYAGRAQRPDPAPVGGWQAGSPRAEPRYPRPSYPESPYPGPSHYPEQPHGGQSYGRPPGHGDPPPRGRPGGGRHRAG